MTEEQAANTRRSISRRDFLGLTSGLVLAACAGESGEASRPNPTALPTETETPIPPTPTAVEPATEEPGASTDRAEQLQRLYVPMRDEVRIAVDVWLPAVAATEEVPTVVRATRYGRSHVGDSVEPEDDENAAEAKRWADRGYALVVVDARGSGASFGSRQVELGSDEIEDYGEIISWIAREPWSNGRVGSYGVSYDGDTAELMASTGNPHLVAIAPQFSDFDPYRQLVYPGGIYLEGPFSTWLLFNDVEDGVEGSIERVAEVFGVDPAFVESQVPGPTPVDGASGADLLVQARQEHQSNASLVDLLPGRENHDDGWVESAVSTHQLSIEASGVPMLVQASWFDAGTAAGALERFVTFSNHQEVWLGPWNHGGEQVLDPGVLGSPLDFEDLSLQAQFDRVTDFFDRFVRDGEAPAGTKELNFTTVGAPGWTRSDVWPLDQVHDETLFLGTAGLRTDPPAGVTQVPLPDVSHTSGPNNRWAGNVSGDDPDYRSWGDTASGRVSFVGGPLDVELTIAGFPVLVVGVESTEPDGTVYAYLEQVTPDGVTHYLTEGMLRLSHRGRIPPAIRTDLALNRSFRQEDRMPMEAAVPTRLVFELFPISVVIPAGHRLQLSLAASDVDNFANYGAPPGLVLGGDDPARLVLPVLTEE